MTSELFSSKRFWYCDTCGESEPVEGKDYVYGDKEPCITCPEGTAIVTRFVEVPYHVDRRAD